MGGRIGKGCNCPGWRLDYLPNGMIRPPGMGWLGKGADEVGSMEFGEKDSVDIDLQNYTVCSLHNQS
ncbi:MAG: hypothetical protein GX364_04395 [Firmicutes bacterium]|jgi:hypothetical protein|nr:hypothetical protein [Bacillota bacterium]